MLTLPTVGTLHKGQLKKPGNRRNVGFETMNVLFINYFTAKD